MTVFWRRTVLLLVLVIAVLQVIHMTLLSRLEARRNERKKTNDRTDRNVDNYSLRTNKFNRFEEEADRKKMFQKVQDSSVLDSSGEYHIINFLVRADGLGHRNHIRKDISLVTQSSVSQLHHLQDIVDRWHGFVSVGVFALSSDIPLAIEAIVHLRRCNPMIKHKANFHLVYPLIIPPPAIGATSPPTRHSIESLLNNYNCYNTSGLIRSLQPGVINYGHSGVPYPNNLLRNVARRNCLTEFVFVIDIDLVPSDKLHQQFLEFANDNELFNNVNVNSDAKTVYVVPAYEIKAKTQTKEMSVFIPEDKISLLKMIESLEARPFYAELCWKCQKYTDYDAWQRDAPTNKLAVLFEVLWRDPWEPFYICKNSVPLYDERFRQYGFNRISQVCELHMSGYKFSVLNNAFVIHKGFKTADTFHKEKDLEQEKNRILFRQFKTELKLKYPNSSRRCY